MTVRRGPGLSAATLVEGLLASAGEYGVAATVFPDRGEILTAADLVDAYADVLLQRPAELGKSGAHPPSRVLNLAGGVRQRLGVAGKGERYLILAGHQSTARPARSATRISSRLRILSNSPVRRDWKYAGYR